MKTIPPLNRYSFSLLLTKENMINIKFFIIKQKLCIEKKENNNS